MLRPLHVSTEFFPAHSGQINIHDYLIIYVDSVEFDGVKYKITDSQSSPFDNKDDLLRYVACYYDFYGASEKITGEYISYEIEEEIPRLGQRIEFIYFDDCGELKQYIYINDGLFQFTNTPTYEDKEVSLLEKSELEVDVVEFTYNTDTNALVYFIEEPEYELAYEQVLLKEGYTILKEIPNEYLEVYHQTYNETSSCSNAKFDTIYEQILHKEGGIKYDIRPALFRTYTEASAISSEYDGQGFYERVPRDSFVLSLRSSYNDFLGFDVSGGCDNYNFFDCMNLDFNYIPSIDTVIYNSYEKCSEGFVSAGKYCYSNSGTVPSIIQARNFEKLVMQATAIPENLPNEYKTLSSIRISNKDEMEDSCVIGVYDSIPYYKLVTPATIEETIVPAIYVTKEWKIYQDGGIIEVVRGEQDNYAQIPTLKGGSYELKENSSNVLSEGNACSLEAIKLRLIAEGYLSENDFDNLKSFHLAALTYQIDNDLPLGVIGNEFIQHLDVNFGF